MLSRNGTGPIGQGRGKVQRQRQGNGRGPGRGGNCVCLSCGATIAHRQGIPCAQEKCPKCGAGMTRQR